MWDLRSEKPRKFIETIQLSESESAWYVIKAYGSKAVQDPASLDILSLSKKTENSNIPDFSGDKHDVCITSPFYFRPAGIEDPEPMESDIDLELVDPSTGRFIENAKIEVLVNGELINSYNLEGRQLKFSMPILPKFARGKKREFLSSNRPGIFTKRRISKAHSPLLPIV